MSLHVDAVLAHGRRHETTVGASLDKFQIRLVAGRRGLLDRGRWEGTTTSSSPPTATAAASIADYRPYLDVAGTTTTSTRWAADVREPLRRPRRRRRRPQLGLGAPPARSWRPTASSPRCIFPNTVPPFFPKVVARAPAARRRPRATSTGAGPGCRPTTAGSPTSAPTRPAAGPASPRSCCTTSTASVAEIRWAGRARAHRRRPAARRAARARACRRCTRPTTSRSGRRARSSACRSTTTAAAPRPTTATVPRRPRSCSCSRSPGGPTARCGTSSTRGVMERHPDAAVRVHRAGHGVDARASSRRLDYYRGRLAGPAAPTGRRRRSSAPASSTQLSLKPSEYWARQCHVGSSFIRRHEVDAAPRGRRRPDHVGQRLPPPRGLLAVLAASTCAWRSPACPRTRCAAMVGGNAAARLRLRPRRCSRRSPPSSARPSPRSPSRSPPRTSPTRRCAARPSRPASP